MEEFHSEPQPEPEVEPAGRPAWVSFIIETAQTLLMAFVLYFLIDAVIGRVQVINISMQPTLYQGELLMVNKLSYRLGEPHLGDVVVFHYPQNPQEDFVKRVIGLPGDTVTISNGQVKVNNQELTEDYIAAAPMYNGKWEVPESSLFVLGDNRNQSSDSHTWGFLPIKNVIGKALVIYWPITRAKILDHPAIVSAASEP